MRRLAPLLAALTLAPTLSLFACSDGPIPIPPKASWIDQIETRLAQHPCVKSLDRWERNYTYKSEPYLEEHLVPFFGLTGWQLARWYDYRIIDIEFQEPGIVAPAGSGIETSFAGRRVHAMIPRSQGYILGDQGSGGDGLAGTYDTATGRLHLWWACGRTDATVPDDP
jgi:hypothetical protein